jgi:hypothetical protein
MGIEQAKQLTRARGLFVPGQFVPGGGGHLNHNWVHRACRENARKVLNAVLDVGTTLFRLEWQ